MGTNSVSCPALGHLGNPQVGGWCAVIQRWWREAREGFEAIAGPAGGNCSSDYEGDVFPPVGRQAKTVTKATWAKRAGCRGGLRSRSWIAMENKLGIEGKLAPRLRDFVDQENKKQSMRKIDKGLPGFFFFLT